MHHILHFWSALVTKFYSISMGDSKTRVPLTVLSGIKPPINPQSRSILIVRHDEDFGPQATPNVWRDESMTLWADERTICPY